VGPKAVVFQQSRLAGFEARVQLQSRPGSLIRSAAPCDELDPGLSPAATEV